MHVQRKCPAGSWRGGLAAHLHQHPQRRAVTPQSRRSGRTAVDPLHVRLAGRGGIAQVDERGGAAAVADDGELPLAHRLDQPVVGRSVEAAVAKNDAAGAGDRILELRASSPSGRSESASSARCAARSSRST